MASTEITASTTDAARPSSSKDQHYDNGATTTTTADDIKPALVETTTPVAGSNGAEEHEGEKPRRRRWLNIQTTYFKTRYFWYALVLGQILALCITSTNTFSTLLSMKGTSIPAFQTFFNYVLLNIVYTPYTVYKYGWRAYFSMILKDGWRYFILAFLDVEGNYFVVLGYRYATILSLQLINFFAIVVVVALSLIFLRVRYHITQYLGILICVGGMGILLASDTITGSNNTGPAADQLKGDLFALLGAALYGVCNTFEEFLVSKRPVYEVLGQLGFWAMFVNGVQAAIFDRPSFRSATWDSAVGGYMTGYTLILFLFYSLAPLLFRLASAAFFNISLLTGNFWGVIIGIQVFHYTVHWMYPIAFVLIILGLFVYFLSESVLGEAKKPWLGESQEEGVAGVGTAKRMQENPDAIV
ncbi:putative solute carrier family 35 member [Lasiodiplodia theobromae]|uniref:Putative solute carrier family 35 member n=1 Tax=Lasiodiplodia theobromae TaxID=45133 RepID=A0A5N5DM94_9PEZI|nr:putative solute carrier family 35 member [Lasiodiplodia theobromae]